MTFRKMRFTWLVVSKTLFKKQNRFNRLFGVKRRNKPFETGRTVGVLNMQVYER